ncbi:hypothetical protein ACFQYP_13285 [Nonomuraea antimicrobica]
MAGERFHRLQCQRHADGGAGNDDAEPDRPPAGARIGAQRRELQHGERYGPPSTPGADEERRHAGTSGDRDDGECTEREVDEDGGCQREEPTAAGTVAPVGQPSG